VQIKTKSYRRIETKRAFAAVIVDYAVVAATVLVAMRLGGVGATLVAIVVIAGRQSALQGLVHSACHRSLFSKRAHNDELQWLYAYPILDVVQLYRWQHLAHHRDFERRTADRFDYIHNVLELGKYGIVSRTWRVFVRPLLGYAGCVFVWDVFESVRNNPKQTRGLIVYWITAISVAWALGLIKVFVMFWVLPLVWLYPVFDIWAELSDHLNAEGESRNQQGLFYASLLKGHEMYHAVHHRYPAVPFYRLGQLSKELTKNGVVMERSTGLGGFLRIVYRR
jgi:fatty acid desaturase